MRPAKRRPHAPANPRFLWITDPWDRLDHPRDTSLRLAEESLALGFENYWCDGRSIRLHSNGQVLVDAYRLLGFDQGREARTIRRSKPHATAISAFTSLQYRTDPPVDLHYLHPLQLLGLGLQIAGKNAPELVNPLEALTASNEKITAGALADLMPFTVASSLRTELERFGRKRGRAVLKPMHQAQSKGVELLDWRTPSKARAALRELEIATDQFTRPAVLQQFLPGIKRGEQRIWFLDGEVLANIRKLPLERDFRVNMDRGSRLEVSPLNAKEKKAAVRIGTYLREKRIRLAAVDLIEGKITDFNITSPGLIPLMEQYLGRNLARPIILALANSAPRSGPIPPSRRIRGSIVQRNANRKISR